MELDKLFSGARLFDILHVDALCIPGRAISDFEPGNEYTDNENPNYHDADQGIHPRAVEIYQAFRERIPIVLNGMANVNKDGTPKQHSYLGPEVWEERLIKLGVAHDHLLRAPGGQNTGDECEEFIRLAQKKRWKVMLSLANPHQIPRMMLAYVHRMKKCGYEMTVIPITPRTVSMERRCYGSQGDKKLPRWQHAFDEGKKIPEQIAGGWLCTLKELDEYLARNKVPL